MPSYTPPLRDMQFVIYEVLHADQHYAAIPEFAELDASTTAAILEEAGKFAAQVALPLNISGDTEGCHLDATSHEVTPPAGYKQAYDTFVQGAWPALSCDPAYGGQGLPTLLNQALYEMLNSANQAWTMYPGLTHGAYKCLHAHGSDSLKQLYLPKLTSGLWSGTMCLTEPHCGTDLGLLRTKAEPQADGSYLLTGQKIFISAGEHNMVENIIHLVLARLPDAPVGSKGISLFVVPKFLPQADGKLDQRNGIHCSGLEHKMGIHGNSTCQMTLESAQGWLIGEPNKGLQAMFVMMNEARLGVGTQSLGLTEVAYQNALTYAQERQQSRSLTGAKSPDAPADSILVHPDVRKMLLTAKAYAEAGRCLTYYTALLLDQESSHPDPEVRKNSAQRVALLTPIVKAFITDNGHTATNACMQVFGGHGYIKEWGMEQLVRDNRINMIYEGTNTIQSLDFLGRKVLGDRGTALKKLAEEVQAFADSEIDKPEMAEFIRPLLQLSGQVERIGTSIGLRALENAEEVGATAVDFLRLVGHWVYAYFWARMASIALNKNNSDNTADRFYDAKIQTARFYYQRLLPETDMLLRSLKAPASVLMDTDSALKIY